MKPILLVASKLRREEPPAVTSQSDTWMNVRQCAAHLQVHPVTLRRWIRLKKIPHIVLPGGGSDYRFMKSVVDEWGRNRALGRQK